MPRPLIGINCDYAHRPSGGKRLALNLNYVRAVEDAGGTPVLLPWQPRASLRRALEAVDGVLLTGGDDLDPALYAQKPHPVLKLMDRERQAFDLLLVREVLSRRIPTLALCLGCQLLNVARKGGLVQDIPSQVPGALGHSRTAGIPRPWHRVKLLPDSHVAQILGCNSLKTNSFHHQSIGRLGLGLTATAWSSDGVVEAVEDSRHPFLVAVQWHPERCYREHPVHAKLFRALVLASRARMPRSSGERRSRPALKNGARRVDKGTSRAILTQGCPGATRG